MSLLTLFNQGPIYTQLLDAANQHHSAGRHQESVIFGQMAAEVAAESRLNALILQVHPTSVQAVLEQQLAYNANLARQEIRRMYDALSGDSIADQPWWSEFTANSKRRNDVAHRGTSVTPDEAARGLAAVSSLIAYIFSS